MLPLAIFENLRFLPSSVSAEVLLMPSRVLLEPRAFWRLGGASGTAAASVGTGGTGGTGLVTRDKEGYSIMIKESVHQDDITVVCVCIYIM